MSLSRVVLIVASLLWVPVACTTDGSSTPAGGDSLNAGDTDVGGDSTMGDLGHTSDAEHSDLDLGDSAATDGMGSDSDQLSDTDPADSSPGDSQVGDDDLTPQGPNVLVNGSFEMWASGLPVDWLGTTTNIPEESVVRYDAAMHDGVFACQLQNTDSNHVRFTTAAMSLAAGRYTCSYWVLGGGEIRNSYYDGDYASYVPAGYTLIDDSGWQQIRYSFNVAADIVNVFELIFSVRNTNPDMNHLVIDDVRCTREVEPCDAVTCESWESCDPTSVACVPNLGRCNLLSDCEEWQVCDATNNCVLASERCETLSDCGDPTPVCDVNSHLCIAGDPCADVTCVEHKECNPTDGSCVLKAGRCQTTADCNGALPVCLAATRTCVAIDNAANVVPNGSFELWEEVSFVPGGTVYNLPIDWYHQDGLTSPPDTEIQATAVHAYTTSAHDGVTALQLVYTNTSNAPRFVSEAFTVVPSVAYSCGLWVRGHGSYWIRTYCGGFGPGSPTFVPIDSTSWQRATFAMKSTTGTSQCVVVLYPSSTMADKDHLQFDEVVCSRENP